MGDDECYDDYTPITLHSATEQVIYFLWGLFLMAYFLGLALFLTWCCRHAAEQSLAGGFTFLLSLILMSIGGGSILIAIFAEYDWKDKPQNRRRFVRNWVAIPFIAGATTLSVYFQNIMYCVGPYCGGYTIDADGGAFN